MRMSVAIGASTIAMSADRAEEEPVQSCALFLHPDENSQGERVLHSRR